MVGNTVFCLLVILFVAVCYVGADETCHCRRDDGMEYMRHCRSCCGEKKNQHCCEDELSGGHIAGIAVVSVTLVAIAVTVGICIYKKKCSTTGKTGPSHLSGPVITINPSTMREPDQKQPLPVNDFSNGVPRDQLGPLPLAEVPMSAPPAYQVMPGPYVPGQTDNREGLVSPPPPYSTPLP